MLLKDLSALRFGPPISHVYNPLAYARKPYGAYLQKYGRPPKKIVLLGMNPGPWGMAQTGVPFGEVMAVSDWLGIGGAVFLPEDLHPKRPVDGYACKRSEVSGRRLWGWAQKAFRTPEIFFERFFVANYCPLLFIEESGRNRTPDRLPADIRASLFAACDQALRSLVYLLKPKFLVGIGAFAEKRAVAALQGTDVAIGRITHPSPANPAANRNWEFLIRKEFKALGIRI